MGKVLSFQETEENRPKIAQEARFRIRCFLKDVEKLQQKYAVEIGVFNGDALGFRDKTREDNWNGYGEWDAYILGDAPGISAHAMLVLRSLTPGVADERLQSRLPEPRRRRLPGCVPGGHGGLSHGCAARQCPILGHRSRHRRRIASGPGWVGVRGHIQAAYGAPAIAAERAGSVRSLPIGGV